MDDLVSRALDLAGVQGATYADIRLVHTNQERLSVRSGVVDTLSSDESSGFGVRVLVDGCWGFASSYDPTPTEIDRVTALAVQIAKSSAQSRQEGVDLGPPVTSRGSYTTPIQVDPFTISKEQKLALLLEADQRMRAIKGVRSTQGNLIFINLTF